MKKKTDESYLSYSQRVTQALYDGQISLSQWCELLLDEEIYGEENLRRCSLFFKKFLEQLDREEDKEFDENSRLAELKAAKEEVIKERKKLQTANLEYQENFRNQARIEMFDEKVVEAIGRLKPIEAKTFIHRNSSDNSTGLLCISDLHAGSTYEIRGMYGEIVNKYDFDTMKERLFKLSSYIDADFYNMDYDNLVIAICGDLFENMLRITSLTKLKEPVIDTVINTSEFLSQWVADLCNRLGIPVKVIIIGGNHDTCSFLGSKPRFEEENLAKLVQKFMEIRFENIEDVEIAPYSDAAVETIQGVNIMFEHGVGNNLQETIDFYSNLYNVDIDEIYSGHLHRPESKAVGVTEYGDRMVYRIGSICGFDTFAKKLHKAARPSAYFALYEEEVGHSWSKNYYL